MSPATILFAALGIAVAAIFIRRWWLNRVPSGWQLGPYINGKNYSTGKLEKLPGGVWSYAFGEPHYVTIDCGDLTGKTLYMRWSFTGHVEPAEAPGEPAWLSLHFQRGGDDWSAAGKYAEYRWYSIQHQKIVEGEFERTMRFEAGHGWVGVMGAADAGPGFAEALRKASRVGLCFGGPGGLGHGATGVGTFKLLDWHIA